MPLTITNVGSANSTTSGTTLAITGINAAVGDWLVVCVAADNAGGGGAASLNGVSDSGSNSYASRGIVNNDPGTASSGITLGCFTGQVTTALSSGTVTVNLTSTVSKAAIVYRVVPGPGEVITLRSDVLGSSGSGLSGGGANIPGVQSGDTVFGAAAIEGNATLTGSTDTTNGTWSPVYTAIANTGTALTSVSLISQWKTVTAAGNQTFSYANLGGADSVHDAFVIYPVSTLPTVRKGYWSMNGITLKNA